MKIFKLFERKNLKKVRNAIEDKVADILERIDNSEKVDRYEEEILKAGIKAAAAEFGAAIPDAVLDYIVRKVVNSVGRVNRAIQKQLRKKG